MVRKFVILSLLFRLKSDPTKLHSLSSCLFLVSLKTDEKDKYKVYIENFERAYLNETTRFYKQKTGQYLGEHGILAYLHYADQKLKVVDC